MADHKGCDVIDIGFDLQDIFDHEQGLQHVDGKDAALFMLRIDLGIVVSTDDHAAMAVIQEVLQRVIEKMERDDHAHFLIFQFRSGLFEECQHGSLSFGQVLTGCTVRPDGRQHACQQVKLIRHERINF